MSVLVICITIQYGGLPQLIELRHNLCTVLFINIKDGDAWGAPPFGFKSMEAAKYALKNAPMGCFISIFHGELT